MCVCVCVYVSKLLFILRFLSPTPRMVFSVKFYGSLLSTQSGLVDSIEEDCGEGGGDDGKK